MFRAFAIFDGLAARRCRTNILQGICVVFRHGICPGPMTKFTITEAIAMQQPENQSKRYSTLFNDIDSGRIKIPQFQRDFVWDKAQTSKLIDSILKGFPIGTFILWKTRERLRHMRNIGNIELPDSDPGDFVQYVLDGQQRITSLYAVRRGLRLSRDGTEINYKDIVIDLSIEPDSEEEVVFESAPEGHDCISIYDLLNARPDELYEKHGQQINLVSNYKQLLESYDFSTVVIEDYPIDTACEIFTRINTSGKELTLFEIMVAKTYDEDQNFDLATRYEELKDGEDKSLLSAGYDTVPPVTVLQCVAAHIGREIRRKDILKLDRDRFIESWDTVKNGLFVTVDYLRSNLGIPVSRILPYNSLLIPLTWFFIQKRGQDVSHRENKVLRQYVYWASLTNRFTSAVDTKVAADLRRMATILEGRSPDYEVAPLNEINADDLIRQPFSVGNAFCKAVICLLSEKGPRQLKTNGIVKLDNSWLQIASSKNYHHFFPRALLKKRGYEDWHANSIMNIVLVDDYLNKQVIKTKAPSEYIKTFMDENPALEDTLATHYIAAPADMGIWDDDYDRFLQERSKLIADELNAILNPVL